MPEARLTLPVETNGQADLLWAQNPTREYVSDCPSQRTSRGPLRVRVGKRPQQRLVGVGSWRERQRLPGEEECDSLGVALSAEPSAE